MRASQLLSRPAQSAALAPLRRFYSMSGCNFRRLLEQVKGCYRYSAKPVVPRSPKLRKTKIGKSSYWNIEPRTTPTSLGHIQDVSSDNANRQFSAHIKSLAEEEAGSKSKRPTAGEVLQLFLDGAGRIP